MQPAEAGVRRAVGERGGCTSVTHRARLRLQRRRLGGSAAAGESERAEPRAACTSAGACAIGERETHALTQLHTRERRTGRAGREPSRSPPPTFPRLGARVGDGRTPLCLFPPHSKLRVTKARTPVKQHCVLSWQRGSSPCSPLLMPGSKMRVSSLEPAGGSQMSSDIALPALLVKYHPLTPTLPTLPHPALTLAWSLRFQKGNWGFCKPLPLPSGDACSQDKRSNPLLQVPTLRPGVKWLLGH